MSKLRCKKCGLSYALELGWSHPDYDMSQYPYLGCSHCNTKERIDQNEITSYRMELNKIQKLNYNVTEDYKLCAEQAAVEHKEKMDTFVKFSDNTKKLGKIAWWDFFCSDCKKPYEKSPVTALGKVIGSCCGKCGSLNCPVPKAIEPPKPKAAKKSVPKTLDLEID